MIQQTCSEIAVRARRRKHIAHYAFAAFIHKKRIAKGASVVHRCIAGKNLRIKIAQDHLRGALVIPAHALRPQPRLLHQQRTKFHRAKMSQIDNFHGLTFRNLADLSHGCCASAAVSQRQNRTPLESETSPCRRWAKRRLQKVGNQSLRAVRPWRKAISEAGTTAYSRNHSAYLVRESLDE